MKITPDTNILVRAAVGDDETQVRAAIKLLGSAELVAITLPCLCEFAWVLDRVYSFSKHEIAIALHTLLGAANVVVDRPAVEAGLAVLRAGGDFADGLIAHEGSWLGGETFVSFDKKAIAVLTKQGRRARLLGH
jgi:predicted nucleic-acid-binding protein